MIDSRAKTALAPIDLLHLRRQAGSDSNLERDVLTMFAARAAADVDRIATATSAAACRDAAHALVGSARAVGAFEVARIATDLAARWPLSASGVDPLRGAVAAVRAFIDRHLAAW